MWRAFHIMILWVRPHLSWGHRWPIFPRKRSVQPRENPETFPWVGSMGECPKAEFRVELSQSGGRKLFHRFVHAQDD